MAKPVSFNVLRFLPCLWCSLSGNSLNDQAVAHLMNSLPSLQSLKSLCISENKFSPGSICLLANSLNLCKRICEVEVRLIDCGIGQDAIQDLCAILEKCDRLAELDLSGNRLGNEGLQCLLEHLPQSRVSCLLKISQNRISQEGILHLINALATYKNVAEVLVSLSSEEMLLKTLVGEDKPQKTLRLKHCSFQPEHLMQLFSGLGKCTTLYNFMSTNNALMVNDAEDLFRTLWKPEGLLRTGIEEPWVKDESIVTFLKMAAGVQGNITALTRDGGLFMVEQEFPDWEEKIESVVSRLHQCELEAKGVSFLPELMEKCCQLWALNWSQVQLTDAEAALTFDTLFHFPALKRLRITCCRIPSAGMKCLAAALHHCHAIEDLDLSSLSLDNANILTLISTLSMMPLLRRLVLSNNHLGSEACLRLAEVLKKAIHMKEVDLSFNKIHSAGMKELTAAFSEMRNVTHVDLSGNNLGDETLGKLATILPSLQRLKVLRLSSCEIDAEGAAHLARAVFQCQQIEELSLSENSVGDKGVTVFVEQLPQFLQLRRIELKVCGITDRASKTLATWLSHCPLLEEVILSWNQLSDDSALELARLLPRLPKLRILELWCNRIPKDVEQRLGGQEPRLHFS
ncbi:Protein NLRC5 [Varanus komodoensis]|nr:Protein NLRC5 [Varanus komodoensis]